MKRGRPPLKTESQCRAINMTFQSLNEIMETHKAGCCLLQKSNRKKTFYIPFYRTNSGRRWYGVRRTKRKDYIESHFADEKRWRIIEPEIERLPNDHPLVIQLQALITKPKTNTLKYRCADDLQDQVQRAKSQLIRLMQKDVNRELENRGDNMYAQLRYLRNACKEIHRRLMVNSYFENRAKEGYASTQDCLRRANVLAVIIKKHTNINTNCARIRKWTGSIRALVHHDEVSLERIDRALRWYSRNIGGKFVPLILSGDTFRRKFGNLEAAIKRQNDMIEPIKNVQERQLTI